MEFDHDLIANAVMIRLLPQEPGIVSYSVEINDNYLIDITRDSSVYAISAYHVRERFGEQPRLESVLEQAKADFSDLLQEPNHRYDAEIAITYRTLMDDSILEV